MPSDRGLLIGGVSVLLFVGSVQPLKLPLSCNDFNVGCRFVETVFFGFSYRKLLVPTAVTQLPAYRSCPSQIQVTFTAYPKLRHGEGGLSAAGLDFPSVSPSDSQQFTDCLARARQVAEATEL